MDNNRQSDTPPEDTQRITGQITKGIGGFYTVCTGTDEVVCRARGRFRKDGIRPLPGDRVTVRLLPDGSGYLEELLPRRNLLVRPPVCNIDLLVILASQAPPRTEPYLIDKMLTAARSQGIDPLLVINKCDLADGESLRAIYIGAGLPVVMTSALTGQGTEPLWELLSGKLVALSGNSGVGKSALLRCLDPQGTYLTGEISEKLGRGRHTTRHVELFSLPRNILAADTPGFAALDTIESVPPRDLGRYYPEFSPYLGQCRFQGCLHQGDLGCAVCQAVEEERIHPIRYQNYRRLLSEAKEQYQIRRRT